MKKKEAQRERERERSERVALSHDKKRLTVRSLRSIFLAARRLEKDRETRKEGIEGADRLQTAVFPVPCLPAIREKLHRLLSPFSIFREQQATGVVLLPMFRGHHDMKCSLKFCSVGIAPLRLFQLFSYASHCLRKVAEI